MKLVVLLCFCIATLFRECHAVCQHSMITPKGLRLDTPEDIYINFHDCPEVVSVWSNLHSYPNRHRNHHPFSLENHGHGNRPVKITIEAKSDMLEERDNYVQYKAFLKVQYCFPPNCQKTTVPEMEILLNKTHGYVFMSTDRPAYRPGDRVKFAVAVTDQHLLRKEAENRMIDLKIKTPEDHGRVTVFEYDLDLALSRNGFVEHSYKITSESILGVWWAEAYIDGVLMAEKSYVIDRYETPTFDVKIHMKQHFILPGQQFIRGKLTAVYSYGERVDGNCYMSFRLARSGLPEEEFYKIPERFNRPTLINGGEKDFEIPMEQLQEILKDGESIENFVANPGSAKVVIMASVTGEAEGVFESDVVDDIIFTTSPYIIDYSQSAKYYLPHTVYDLKVTIRDVVSNQPMSEVRVMLEWGCPECTEEFISDENGEINHKMNLDGDEVQMMIRTTSPGIAEHNQQHESFPVYRNIADRHLAMRVDKRIIEVNERQHVTLVLGEASPDTIRYFVLSRGEVVYSDVLVVGGRHGEIPISFLVTYKMVPSARIVAYYILDNTMSSNSVWFDVINVCKNELQIELDEPEIVHGDGESENVEMTVRGQPNLVVLFSAIDRAAYFVHNGTRVTRDLLWSKMDAYDTGCSRKGGRDAMNVFEEAGLIINAPVVPLRTYSSINCLHSRKRRSVAVAPTVTDEFDIMKTKCADDGNRRSYGQRSCYKRSERVVKNLKDKNKDSVYIKECKKRFLKACKVSLQNGRGRSASLARRAGAAADNAREARSRPRKNFAEDLYFGVETLGNNGLHRLTPKIPDSITTFELDVFGMNNIEPMCVARTKYLKIFKKLFIQLYLPYSVRLREQAQIRFAVFNYNDEPVEDIPISIRHSAELCSKFGHENFQEHTVLSIDANSASSSSFTILPLKIPDDKKGATIEIQAGGDDAILKKLLIEEPGQRNESSQTMILSEEESPKNMFFDIPKFGVMPNSVKCSLYAYAHPMGPSFEIEDFDDNLDNLEGFIQQPTGCGEQNMIRIGPNVYVHKYRVSVDEGAVTPQQNEQIINHIQSAYSIELGWRSDAVNKRAFAVWNSHPPSTWLNAYVDRTFAAAKEFWQGMPVEPFCNSLDWLLEMQNNDGSFRENYKLHHGDMSGLVNEAISLTAYVSISIREAMFMCPVHERLYNTAIEKAIAYIRTREDEAVGSRYTLAMVSYALAKEDPSTQIARDWNRRLRDASDNDGEYIFWRGGQGRASDIETTAYALMAELTLNGINAENDIFTRNIAFWLISQQNNKGGFKSTQDTVVGLQSLAMYMEILETSIAQRPPSTNLRVSIRSISEDSLWHVEPHPIHLTTADTQKRREINDIDSGAISEGIMVDVEGDGDGSLSYRCTWRQYSDDGNCQFEIDVTIEDGDNLDADTRILKVSVRKTHEPSARMSIIDVGLLTGYVPDEDSIKLLIESVDAEADRFEITQNTVKFYITDIDIDGTVLAFKIREISRVDDRQPTAVSAYDYYEPDIRCTKFYNENGRSTIQSICDDGNGEDQEKICRCAEGDCPVCRTRQEQLENTVCSKHRKLQPLCVLEGEDENLSLCRIDESECTNIHVKGCKSKFVYVVHVTKVGDDEDTPGFKYFLARVDEIFKNTAQHKAANNSIVKFLMREDCFNKCEDERYQIIAAAKAGKTGQDVEAKHFISVGRDLLVYGGDPYKDDSGAEPRYVYDLTTENHGLEAVLPVSKCYCNEHDAKCIRRYDNDNKRRAICKMKSILRASITEGCDVD